MFVTEMRDSERYRSFWASLDRGEYQAGEYKRVGRNGR
jgi:methyl-accepting chemotaxis protein